MTKFSSKILALMVIAGALVLSSCKKDKDDDINKDDDKNTEITDDNSIKTPRPATIEFSTKYDDGHAKSEETINIGFSFDAKGNFLNIGDTPEELIIREDNKISFKSDKHNNQTELMLEFNNRNHITKLTNTEIGSITNMSTGESKTFYTYWQHDCTYNNNGQITSIKSNCLGQKIDNNTEWDEWNPQNDEDYTEGLTEFIYDEEGKLTLVKIGGQEVYQYVYSEDIPNPKKQMWADIDAMDWELDEMGTILSAAGLLGYGSTKFPTEIDGFDEDNHVWVPETKISYKFDENGNLKEQSTTNGKDYITKTIFGY